ncbi:hypothetical protein GCM10010289_71350 [Streptomyces violascens]|nr:hypothetical protein GCM10010289_71350 [Streptomyces violascens]
MAEQREAVRGLMGVQVGGSNLQHQLPYGVRGRREDIDHPPSLGHNGIGRRFSLRPGGRCWLAQKCPLESLISLSCVSLPTWIGPR